MVQVICESCGPFDIAEELSADIEMLAVDAEVLALVAAASRRVRRAGERLKLTSMEEMLVIANNQNRP